MSEQSMDTDDAWIFWWWAVVPLLILGLLYCAMAATLWPYARPLFPLWLLVFALFFPPLFPFVFFYALFATFFFPRPVLVSSTVPTATVRVVVEEGKNEQKATGRGGGLRDREVPPGIHGSLRR